MAHLTSPSTSRGNPGASCGLMTTSTHSSSKANWTSASISLPRKNWKVYMNILVRLLPVFWGICFFIKINILQASIKQSKHLMRAITLSFKVTYFKIFLSYFISFLYWKAKFCCLITIPCPFLLSLFQL
jgi:hypothetical protein